MVLCVTGLGDGLGGDELGDVRGVGLGTGDTSGKGVGLRLGDGRGVGLSLRAVVAGTGSHPMAMMGSGICADLLRMMVLGLGDGLGT